MSRESTGGVERWDRRRLLATLGAVTVAAMVLLLGLGYAVAGTITTVGRPSAPPQDGTAQQVAALRPGPARRDAIASAPMLAVPPQAGRGGAPAALPAPSITVPAAGQVGPAQVPTGYPPTPAGAVGQLAAIEVAVLQRMSVADTDAIHRAWADPGAPPAADWELMSNVQAFLASRAGQDATAMPPLVTATPVAAQVKGTDGPHWVLACVLLKATARAATTATVAYGHCERMRWTTTTDGGGRWVIAPGPPASRAPSTWPGTDLAAHAGWRTWTSDPKE